MYNRIQKIIEYKPMIIAICGPKRSGKDTIADHLITKYNYEKIKIADPLKMIVKDLFGFTENQVGETDDKDIIDERWGITPRKALQFFGTEVMQYKIQELLPGIGRKFWINRLIDSSISNPIDNQKYVISDLRFLHEYEELYKKTKDNLCIIKVFRPDNNDEKETHVSELEYKGIKEDILIINDGNIEDLLVKLDNALSRK